MSEKAQLNFIDRVISIFNPSAGLARAQARFRMDRLSDLTEAFSKRKYEGASAGRRTDGWSRPGTDADSEIRPVQNRMRNTVRDMVRNNPYAKNALTIIANRVVGKGIRPVFMVGKENANILQDRFNAWAMSKDAADYDGVLNFFGIEKLVMKTVVSSGEALVRRYFVNDDRGRVSLQIQVLEPDFLDITRDGTNRDNGNPIISGIEYDKESMKRVAYWLYSVHPGSRNIATAFASDFFSSSRIPAEEIAHIYKVDRPGQQRGVTWFDSVIVKLHDVDEANDAYLFRQKIAACFAAFIYDTTGSDDGNTEVIEKIEPGIIESLPPGKSIEFAEPPGVDGFSEFSRDQLHSVAAGLGISYEELATDLRGVSFLSGRMGQISSNRNVDDWQSLLFVPQFCDKVLEWFLIAAFFDGITIPDGLITEWVLPTRSMLDPSKEFKILQAQVRSGMPWEDFMQEMGYQNPQQAAARKQSENEMFDMRGLILDIDPRKVSAAGNIITDQQDSNSADQGGSNTATTENN